MGRFYGSEVNLSIAKKLGTIFVKRCLPLGTKDSDQWAWKIVHESYLNTSIQRANATQAAR
jgi:hypothetical protein